MRFTIQSLFLSGAALYTSTVLATSNALNEAIRDLHRDSSDGSRIQLSADHKSIEAVNGEGKVVDQVDITAAQEAAIRSDIIVSLMASEPPKKEEHSRRRGDTNMLIKRGCPAGPLYCEDDRLCRAEGCEGCFRMSPIAVCYGYSK